MRIVQLIDSLEAGGAERMSVNYANALVSEIEFSGLVATRKEGPLVSQLDPGIGYLFLNRKSILDVAALLRLRNFVRKNKVTIVHAHGTSFFMGVLLQLINPNLKLVWHDHYGNSEFLNERPSLLLRVSTLFFIGIITVNETLKSWSKEKLKSKNCIYLPNFYFEEKTEKKETFLKGTAGKRIVCLANLRPQKNHGLLVELAKILKVHHPDWSFHLVGKDWNDAYSLQIKNEIKTSGLEEHVFLYGGQNDISNILEQSTIGILTSKSEGLPVALLEYGRHKKPVIVTAVGELPFVIQNGVQGYLVPSQDITSFYTALEALIHDQQKQIDFGSALHQKVLQDFSAATVLKKYINWLENSSI